MICFKPPEKVFGEAADGASLLACSGTYPFLFLTNAMNIKIY